MMKIFTDIRISRRKMFNHVLDENDDLVFTAPTLAACLSWLLDQGELQALLHREHDTMKIDFIRVPE